MSTNKSSDNDVVTARRWQACYNSSDNVLVVSCTVSSADSGASITGVGLVVNDAEGSTLASFYNRFSSGSETVYPAFNLPLGTLSIGDAVFVVVQGECSGQHFFIEEEMTIANC